MLIQFVFHIGQGELGAPHWNIQLRQDPGQRADVVLVTMRKHNSAHPLAILNEIGDIRDDDVDAK